MSPAFRAMVAQNPSLADGYAKLAKHRDAGYTGPLDQDGNIPDPDDPRTREAAEIFARLSGH